MKEKIVKLQKSGVDIMPVTNTNAVIHNNETLLSEILKSLVWKNE